MESFHIIFNDGSHGIYTKENLKALIDFIERLHNLDDIKTINRVKN